MEITEVRVKLMEDPNERLQAFCSITFDDCFVVRDLKIIDGTNGLFVAMPSRKLTARCPQCGCKNHARSNYCNQCGLKMAGDRAVVDESGRAKLYADIAHPINSQCRETIQQRIIEAYHQEVGKAQQPNYRSTYDDFDVEDHVAVAVDAPKPKSGKDLSHTSPSHTDPPRTDSPHLATEPPHIRPVAQPQPEEQPQPEKQPQPSEPTQDARPQGSHTTSAAHAKPGPHTKPDRAKSRDNSEQSKPSGGFGSGIL